MAVRGLNGQKLRVIVQFVDKCYTMLRSVMQCYKMVVNVHK